jgi:F-type H+-transporting ATPase subunit b
VLINWFTVFAQILNFLILVALLRIFLYQPILKVMQKRQAQIDAHWQEAQQSRTEARQETQIYQQKRQELQQQQDELLSEARSVAEQERQRLLVQVRQEMAELRWAWQEDLRQEEDAFLQTLRQKVIHQTYLIAHKALTDLANTDLEQQMIQVFSSRLRHLDKSQWNSIVQALSQTNQPILVRSSMEMPSQIRQRVIDELRSQFGVTHGVEFSTAPDLLCGIEIKLAGQEIVWSLDTYLQALEQRLSTALTQEEESNHEQDIPATTGSVQ